MKTCWFCVLSSLLVVSADAELAITGVSQRDAVLSWTNSVTNAVYRIETAPSTAGPWTTLTNLSFIQASNQQVAVQLPPPGAQRVELFRVVWSDAPLALPVGNWEYKGFDPSGALAVTGLISITASNPLSGSYSFQVAGANPNPIHPVSSGAFTDGVFVSSNKLQIPLPAGTEATFGLSGQMALDEYWGSWTYTYSRVGMQIWYDRFGIEHWYSRVENITLSGRFSARRVD